MKRKRFPVIEDYADDDQLDTSGMPSVPSGTAIKTPPLESYGLSVIRFSNKCAAAGLFKGAGEHLDPTDKLYLYFPLEELISDDGAPNHWRRTLSSFYATKEPIPWRGRHYATQEHAVTAMKFVDKYPEFAEEFALEHPTSPFRHGSEVQWAKDAGSFRGKHRKGNKIIWTRSPEIKPATEVEMYGMDDELKAQEDESRMLEAIMYNKYYYNKYPRDVLLATDYTLLVEGTGKNLKPQIELMNVRERLRYEAETCAFDEC